LRWTAARTRRQHEPRNRYDNAVVQSFFSSLKHEPS